MVPSRAVQPAPGRQRSLSGDAILPHQDTLSPLQGEVALPAPPATHTVITTGRAEASEIIGGDSLVLERHVPWVRQDFPEELVCRATWHPGVLAAVQGLADSSALEQGWGWVWG